jgi:hypothetical protein
MTAVRKKAREPDDAAHQIQLILPVPAQVATPLPNSPSNLRTS